MNVTTKRPISHATIVLQSIRMWLTYTVDNKNDRGWTTAKFLITEQFVSEQKLGSKSV